MTNAEFNSHPVSQKTEQFLNRLHEDEVKEKLEVEKLDFFKTAGQFITNRLKITLPTLIPIAEFNAVANDLDSALAQINAFIGNNNIGHINNAVNNINSALTYVKSFPVPYQKSDLNFSKQVSEFQLSIKDKYEQTGNLQKALEKKIDDANTKLTEKEAELVKINEKISLKEKEIETLNTNFQTQFNTTTAAYVKQVADDRVLFRTEIDADRKQIAEDRVLYKSEIDADREKIKTDTTATINDLQTKLNDAKKLVNVIGNVGVTGNYQNIANHHKTTANVWRVIAIGFMCLLSALLIYSIWKVSDPTYDWHKAIIRIVAAAILIYPATYAARESSRHRHLENINRKSELELAAINPFIEMLDESKKQLIKEKLVEKYFGNNAGDNHSDKEESVSIDAVERLIKLISSVTKK